jgi:flagellar motor component MotA
MIPREWFGRARCAREERAATIPLMQSMMGLAADARHDGLLSLKDSIKETDPPLMKDILGLVLDMLDIGHIMSYGVTRIAASGLQGSELLEALVILQGALSIGNGENPVLLDSGCRASWARMRTCSYRMNHRSSPNHHRWT